MNTPKKIKRAEGIDPSEITTPGFLSSPVSDHVAAYIGHVVTEYVHTERKMIKLFRVVLGIESGEAAALAYYAIKAPKARWDIVRQVLEKDNLHAESPGTYDQLIGEFHKITKFRNECVHHLWQMDEYNQPWKTDTDSPRDSLTSVRFGKSLFDEMLKKMDEIRNRVTDATRTDLSSLDERWLERRKQAHGNDS